MKRLIDMTGALDDLLTPGRPVSDLKDAILAMDAHVAEVLREQEFDPGKLPTEDIANGNADRDLAVARATQELCRDNPVLYLPALYQSYEDYVYQRVSEDLALFATDFSGGRNIQFILSTSSFGYTSSCTNTPITDKNRIRDLMDALAAKGYAIAERHGRRVLLDCDVNKALLRQYCEQTLDTRVTQILIWRDTIRSVTCSTRLDAIRPFACPEPEDVPVPDTLSDDMVAVIRNILIAIRDAAAMADVPTWCSNAAELKLLAMANVQATMYDLEAVTGIYAGAFDAREAHLAPLREMHRKLRAIQSQIRLDSAGIAADAASLYDSVYEAVENFAATMGMSPSTVQFRSHDTLRMELCPDSMGVSDGKTRPARMKLMRPSPDCMGDLLSDLQMELPSIRIDDYTGAFDANNTDAPFKVKGLNLRLNDTRDLVPLLKLYGNDKD